MDKITAYKKLANIFKENHFHLFLVGGTVRDYLFSIPLSDMDAVTDATPEDMKVFLKDADYTFSRFGSVKVNYEGNKFDITTMREEKQYSDSRHPNEVKFIKDLSIDVKRRDFTINALYLDENMKVIDYVNGQNDISTKILRMVGNPDIRIKEDPLRIIRAIRFALDYDLSFDKDLENAIIDNINLIENLNQEKVKQDIRKMKCKDLDKIKDIFAKFHILYLLNMLEY